MHIPNGEPDSDVDRVCETLKKEYSWYDKAVEALNGCEVSVSNSLIEKLLKRFDNDWIPSWAVFTWVKLQRGYEQYPCGNGPLSVTYKALAKEVGERNMVETNNGLKIPLKI
ncbi:hypothetical protein SLA2020_500990 [Shorea laevis]